MTYLDARLHTGFDRAKNRLNWISGRCLTRENNHETSWMSDPKECQHFDICCFVHGLGDLRDTRNLACYHDVTRPIRPCTCLRYTPNPSTHQSTCNAAAATEHRHDQIGAESIAHAQAATLSFYRKRIRILTGNRADPSFTIW